jgi:hypothetical protein
MRYLKLSLLYPLLLLGLLQAAAVAQPLPERIGHLARVSGTVSFVWRGRSDVANLGQAIVPGMRLRTGAGGAAAVLLDDGTLLALGSHSELVVEQYLFDPARQRFRLAVVLNRGTLSFSSGAIGRLDPEAVSLTTPVGKVRVRDANLLLKVAS